MAEGEREKARREALAQATSTGLTLEQAAAEAARLQAEIQQEN